MRYRKLPVESEQVIADTRTVEAIQLAYPVEIFRPDGHYKGKAGDFLVIVSPTDQYICDGEVFLQSYEVAVSL